MPTDLRALALDDRAARLMVERSALHPAPGMPTDLLDARRILGTVDLRGLHLVVWELRRGDVMAVGVHADRGRVSWLVSCATRGQWQGWRAEAAGVLTDEVFDRLVSEGLELRREFDRITAPMRRW